MGRYVKADNSGGQLPTIRYLSKTLLNRIRFDERAALSAILPDVVNGLGHDRDYDIGIPDRTSEALQTWETLAALNREVAKQDIEASLSTLAGLTAKASAAYATLSQYGITAGYETITEYLEQLRQGIEVFRKLAEI